jgi:hypothetical protein
MIEAQLPVGTVYICPRTRAIVLKGYVLKGWLETTPVHHVTRHRMLLTEPMNKWLMIDYLNRFHMCNLWLESRHDGFLNIWRKTRWELCLIHPFGSTNFT